MTSKNRIVQIEERLDILEGESINWLIFKWVAGTLAILFR